MDSNNTFDMLGIFQISIKFGSLDPLVIVKLSAQFGKSLVITDGDVGLLSKNNIPATRLPEADRANGFPEDGLPDEASIAGNSI